MFQVAGSDKIVLIEDHHDQVCVKKELLPFYQKQKQKDMRDAAYIWNEGWQDLKQ